MGNRRTDEFRYAFPRTVPVMVGYLFLGAAYGILMNVNGFGFWWAVGCSVFVFAGSLQYLGVTLLVTAVNPLYALLMALMLNARHLFYGISMLEAYKDLKKGKAYLIFALTDETFSVLCHEETPKNLDRNQVFLWIAFLDHCYWIVGTVLGALAGSFITFNTKGLDFALTALFVVIFTEQWESCKDHRPALIGVLGSVACLLIFGQSAFIIPAMLTILAVLTIGYSREKKKGEEHHA